MAENFDANMDQLVRDRAVAPLDSGSPALPSKERRAWWEFCLWMHEFLGNLIRDHAVTREQAQQLARLQWIVLKGSHVFATSDPVLRGEQRRYVELCGCLAAAFAVIVDDPDGIRDLCEQVFAMERSKEPAECEALVGEAWLSWWKTWEHATSPIAWVRHVAERIHLEHRPLAIDQELHIRSLDAPSPTGDPYAALLPDLLAVDFAEIDATVDLSTACEREGLAPETSRLARGRYHSVPTTVAGKMLGLSDEGLAAAKRELRAAMPALQARLAPYREKRKTEMKQV
jgi:hypothetical protein